MRAVDSRFRAPTHLFAQATLESEESELILAEVGAQFTVTIDSESAPRDGKGPL